MTLFKRPPATRPEIPMAPERPSSDHPKVTFQIDERGKLQWTVVTGSYSSIVWLTETGMRSLADQVNTLHERATRMQEQASSINKDGYY